MRKGGEKKAGVEEDEEEKGGGVEREKTRKSICKYSTIALCNEKLMRNLYTFTFS